MQRTVFQSVTRAVSPLARRARGCDIGNSIRVFRSHITLVLIIHLCVPLQLSVEHTDIPADTRR